MYIKLLGAGICFVLSLFNVLGAMERVPVKTTIGNSSRPAVAMMKPPGSNLHWLSGGVFFIASISLIAWAIWEYNSNVDVGIESIDIPAPPVNPAISETDAQMSQYLNIEPTQLQGGIKPALSTRTKELYSLFRVIYSLRAMRKPII